MPIGAFCAERGIEIPEEVPNIVLLRPGGEAANLIRLAAVAPDNSG